MSGAIHRDLPGSDWVRVATKADTSEIVRVVNAAYRVEDFFVDSDRTDARDVASRMEMPGGRFLVIDRSRVTSEAGSEVRSDSSEGPTVRLLCAAAFVRVMEDRGTYAMLSVDPQLKGKGLGRRLLEGVEDYLYDAGCRVVDIEVVDLREELPTFYRKFGYVPTGTGPFPDPHKLKRPAHVVVMSKTLGRP